MSGARVNRWRRYGKDRLYVEAVDGLRLGWHDLVTGDSHVEVPERVDDFRSAVATWLHAHSTHENLAAGIDPGAAASAGRAGPSAAVAVVDPPDTTADVVEEDLAARRAGALAREQAVALKQQAPVRTLLARVLGVHTDERAWRVGADGEEKVAAQLERLVAKDPRWHCLHAVPVGDRGADIDHLVIGPGGVYTLNAKHHKGAKVWVGGDTFLVNGARQPYVRNSRHEALRASRLLSSAVGLPVLVTGVVVPVGAAEMTVKSPPQDVRVVNRMRLAGWLRDRPELLDEATVASVLAVARRPATWRAAASPRHRRA